MTTDLLEFVIQYIQNAHGERTFVHLTAGGGEPGFLCTVIPWGKEPLHYPGKDLTAAVHNALRAAREVRLAREVAA